MDHAVRELDPLRARDAVVVPVLWVVRVSIADIRTYDLVGRGPVTSRPASRLAIQRRGHFEPLGEDFG
jgi:hypothetical protein